MVFKNLCILVLWKKVASALEGLNILLSASEMIISKLPLCGDRQVPVESLLYFRVVPAFQTYSQPAGRLDAFLDTQTLKSAPQDTQISLCGISKNLNLKLIIEFFHLLIIPMTLFIHGIMPYFDEFIHVNG